MKNIFIKIKKNSLYLKFRSQSKEAKLLIVAFILILFGLTIAAPLTTDFGALDVMKITLPTENGQWVSADLYKPKSATSQNKAPVIVVVPGFQRTRETQTNMGLELARRGIVTIVIDPYAQGDSSASFSTQAATTEGYGAMAVVEYIHETPNMNYVDKTRVGMTGHSAGGNAAVRSAQRFGIEVIDGLREESKLKAIFNSGYVLTFTENTLSTVRSNVGMDYAYFDEGAFRNEYAQDPDIIDADMRTAYESINLVNSGLIQNGDNLVDEVEIGQIYGSPFNNTMRQVFNVRDIHAFQIYNRNSTANMLNFFEIALDYEMPLEPDNQTYMIKEAFQGLMLIGGALFIFGFGGVLLKTPFFASLVHPLPPQARSQTKKDKLIFWSVFVFAASVASMIFIPLARQAQVLFPNAESGIQTSFFPFRMLNSVLLWAVVNGIIGFGVYFTLHFSYAKKNGATLESLRTNVREFVKTIFYALTVVFFFYLIIHVIYKFFHVDFRLTFIAARVLENNGMLLYSLMYIPLFYIFYLMVSVRVNNTMRIKGWSELKGTLIGSLANSVGLIVILAIQYIYYGFTNEVFWTDEWLYVNILFGIIPMMFILPIFNRYFFNRTGRVYSGPMIAVIIFILMALTGSVAYIPV